jgi:uroporphyrinogen-III decarboxylase
MGYHRALKALNLEYTDQIPLLGDIGVSRRTALKLTGMTKSAGASYIQALYKALDVDMIYAQESSVDPSYTPFKRSWRRPTKTIYGDSEFFRKRLGEFGDAFHLAYKGMKLAQSPVVSQLWVVERPFKTYQEMLDYLESWDPREQETRSVDEIADKHRVFWKKCQELLEDVTLVAGVTYATLWTFFIIHLGYPNLTRLIHQNLDLLKEAMKKFSQVTKKYHEAWAKTGIKAFVQHDDVATENGPMMSPQWFSEHLFPLFKEMWKPFKERGIKVINISDGNHILLLEGYAEVGSDGFKVNPDARLSHNDLEQLYEKWGGKKILMFAPNREITMYGTRKETIDEIEFMTSLAKEYNGAFLHGINSQHHPTTAYKTWIKNRRRD